MWGKILFLAIHVGHHPFWELHMIEEWQREIKQLKD